VAGDARRRQCPAVSGPSALATDTDDQHRPVVGPDRLRVVGDRAVPADVVARTGLDHVIALGHPEPAAQDEVVLVPRVGVGSRARTGPRDRLDDRDTTSKPAVDPLHPSKVLDLDRALGASDHGRGRRVLEEEPRDRHLEGISQAGQAGQRRLGLVVLDLRQVADVQPCPLGDAREGQASLGPPSTDLDSYSRLAASFRAFDPGCFDVHIVSFGKLY